MFCRFCGTQLNDNAIFCNNCGNRLKGTNTDTIDYASLSLGGEIKKSKLLYITSFIYLIWSFVSWFLFRQFAIVSNTTYVEIISISSIVIQCFFWGALAYAATKRSVKFTLIFTIPYLLFEVAYPFIFDSFKYIMISPTSLFEYVGGIIIPFAILGILKIVKILMTNVKSKWPLGIISVVVTVVMFLIYLTANYWISYADESGIGFHLSTQMLIYYAAGITVSNILMHIVYKGH